jgi:predicted MFS family arabinose efflux permease
MRRAKFITLFSITGIYFFSMFQRVAVPGTIFNELQSAYAASAALIASLGAIYLYIYGGMQLFAGILADGIGSSKTIFIGGVLLAVSSILFPLSANPVQLQISRAAVGLGASLIYISMLKHIDITFSAGNFPLVFSTSIVAGYSGGLAATYPFERLSELIGWKESLIIAGIVCMFFVVLSSFRLRKTFNFRKKSRTLSNIKNILKNKAVYPLIASGSANFSVYFLLQASIGKKMLEDFAGFTSSRASLFTFAMMLTTMISVLFHGCAGKKTGCRKIFSVTAAVFTMVGAVLILVNLCISGNSFLFLLPYLLCAWAGGNILNATLMKEMNIPDSSATAVGVYNGAMYSSVALTANIAGLVMDVFKESAVITTEAIIYPASSYKVIFSGCSVLGLISVLSALRIKEPSSILMPGSGTIVTEE